MRFCEWDDFVPMEDHPREIDPDRGYVLTAGAPSLVLSPQRLLTGPRVTSSSPLVSARTPIRPTKTP